MQTDDRFSELDIVARTLYAEAEGEGCEGASEGKLGMARFEDENGVEEDAGWNEELH